MTRIDGPNGLWIELDPKEHYADDPGRGTPAMVYKGPNRKYCGTFDCVMLTGELNCGEYCLTDEENAWIESQADDVYDWLDRLEGRVDEISSK